MQSRYSRQELYKPFGKDGQRKLREATVVIAGCGALGSLQAEMISRAGIGRLILIDRDFVEYTNLQRQSLFRESDAERSIPKAIAAAERIREINSDVEVVPHVADLSPDSLSLCEAANLILDGTDNFQTRFLINDYCWKKTIPWIYGACVGASGAAAAFVPDSFPCLRCLFESEPPPGSAPTCDTAGILWPAAGTVVSYQMVQAFKILTGSPVSPQILHFDLWDDQNRIVGLGKAKRSDCETCGSRRYPALQQTAGMETSLCGRDAVQIRPQIRKHLDLDAIHERWLHIGKSYRNPFLIKLPMEKNEIVLFPDGRAIIKGTSDFSRARDLYAKYVGN